MMTTTYTPQAKVAEVLRWALAEVENVPYEVPTRWVFYQVVQHHGLGKGSYKKFLKWLSRARKGRWEGWSPTSLVDDTRPINLRDGGYSTPAGWFESFRRRQCTLDVASRQDNVLLVLYEAQAMSRQFDHYLGPLRVSSAPFKGDASIREKADIAARLRELHDRFPDSGVVVLYFGDLDTKGLEIPRNALRDIYRWYAEDGDGSDVEELQQVGCLDGSAGREEWRTADLSFRWIRVGLTLEHVRRWDLPDNPERPNTYQWEALADPAASEMITGAVAEFWDADVVSQVEEEEDRASERFQEAIEDVLRGLSEDSED